MPLTRRDLLAAGAAGLCAGAAGRSGDAQGATPALVSASGTLGELIHEITMAAPDIVCIEFRDTPFTHGSIVPIDPPARNARAGSWIRRDGTWGRVIGPDRAHFRTADTQPIPRVDTGLVDRTDYASIGGQDVGNVYRKSVPYASGAFPSQHGRTVYAAAFKHYVYLKLAGALEPGRHRIVGPDAAFEAELNFYDKATRAITIRANQHGHRPGDIQKIAYLALWLPGGPDRGAFRFDTYDLQRFQIIDADGNAVFSGPIELRFGPTELESSEAMLLSYVDEAGETFEANRAGTFVYGLDYSGWTDGREGTYRIQIDGLGVSDPFQVSETAWYDAARVSLSGLYHHRSGIELDGRFGYRRPVSQRPGINGRVYNSRLPYLLSSSNKLGFIRFGDAARAPWVTDEENGEAWGGYMDAGDWDRRTNHLQLTTGLLLIYETLPVEARDISWGLPKSSEILDPEVHSELDGLPDLIHEAAFGLDLYRRMQDPQSGAIRGGIESAGGPVHGEASFFESQTVFAFAPDHESAWNYVAAAARLARTVRELDAPRLADLYQTSAEAAFDWAEQVHADLDTAYAEAIEIATQQGAFEETPWADYRSEILARTVTARASAAAALFRLSGAARYREIFEELFDRGFTDREAGGDARWDYAMAEGGGRRFRTEPILNQFATTARRYIVSRQLDKTNYRSTKWGGIPMFWGQGNAPDYNQIQMLVRAHHHTRHPVFLRCLQAAAANVLGANQVGICMTTGLGHRTVKHPLHEDHMAMGVPAPSGITLYGYGAWQRTDYPWVWGDNAWSVMPPAGSRWSQRRAAEGFPAPTVHPFRKSMPLFEYFIEHPLMIMQQEYTVHQTINTMSMLTLYLHAHDGNRIAERD